jgi:MtN3 and saliva related transmembrane protein
MESSVAELFGDTAAVLTTVSFFPQALQVLRTRDTQAISLAMYAMFTAGIMCWGIYGLMTMQWSIILANGITLVIAALILTLKLRDVLAARRAAKINA